MNDIMRWWNGLSPNDKGAAYDAAIIVAGLFAGWIVGRRVKRLLVTKGIDKYFHAPWAPADVVSVAPVHRGRSRIEASVLSSAVGWACTAMVWAAALWWIAGVHESRSTVESLQYAMLRGGQGAIVIFAALLAGGWIAHMVYDLFQTPWLKREMDTLLANATGSPGSFSETAARAVCVAIYAAFLLVVPVIVAGMFNFAPLSGLVNPAWQMFARLFTAMAAFAVGYLGLAWVRSHTTLTRTEGADHSEVEYYVGLGIMVATTLLALGLLVGFSNSAAAVGMLAVVAFFMFLLWPIRSHFRDLWAGLMLRLQNSKAVTIDGTPMNIKEVGLLVTGLVSDGQECTRRNSEVLAQVLKASEKPI